MPVPHQIKNKYRQGRVLTVIHTCQSYVHSPRADSSHSWLLEEQSSPKWDLSVQDADEHHAKFDADSFILAGAIRNRTNKKETVYDISKPCLSACVYNKLKSSARLFFSGQAWPIWSDGQRLVLTDQVLEHCFLNISLTPT